MLLVPDDDAAKEAAIDTLAERCYEMGFNHMFALEMAQAIVAMTESGEYAGRAKQQ